MPGGRWLATPGTNFESAAYALAMGMATAMLDRRFLKWSTLTTERQVYDAIKPMCNTEMVACLRKEGAKFDPQRALDPTSLSVVIGSWNARMSPKIQVNISSDGQNTVVPSRGHVGSKSVYVRRASNRWEVFGHFEDSATTETPVQAANTFFTNPQVNTKLTINSKKLLNTYGSKHCLPADSSENKCIKSMARNLRDVSIRLTYPIEKLFCFTEVLDVPCNEALRPSIDLLYSEYLKVCRTSTDILISIDSSATEQEKDRVRAMMEGFTKHKRDDRVKQKKIELTGQKEDEDVAQRSRNEANSAATYAAQDRDDSCSDSD